jgi:hypothetical protein
MCVAPFPSGLLLVAYLLRRTEPVNIRPSLPPLACAVKRKLSIDDAA